MDWKPITDSALSAIAGGSVTALASWVKVGRIMTKHDMRLSALEKSLETCQGSRDVCRGEIMGHISDAKIHVTDDRNRRLDDIHERLGKIEERQIAIYDLLAKKPAR